MNQRVESLLTSGLTPREILTKLPKSNKHVILKIRKSLGMPPFKTGAPTGHCNRVRKLIARATQMKVDGLSYRQISENLNVSRQRAAQLLRTDRFVRGGYKNKTCSSCAKVVAVVHNHHTDYASGHTVLLCPQCHCKETLKSWSHAIPRGENHRSAKVNSEDVRKIRRLYSEGRNMAAVGRAFGITKGTVWAIIKNRTWKHVT